MFDPLVNREHVRSNDCDILMLDDLHASFDACRTNMEEHSVPGNCSARDRSFSDSAVVLTSDRKQKRLEQQRHFHVKAARRRLALALSTAIHFFGRILGRIHVPNFFALSRSLNFRRIGGGRNRARGIGIIIGEGTNLEDEFEQHAEAMDESLDVEDVFSHAQDDDEKENGERAMTLKGQQKTRSHSMQHTRSQSLQQCSSSDIPSLRYPRSQSLSHIERSMSMPTLIEESVYDENTVLYGDGKMLHARYRDSHEPRPFSEGPPSPELLNGRRKKAQSQQAFDTGYGNTTHYQKGAVRRAMKDFRSLEEMTCQEYLESRLRRQNVVVEEIRSKIPMPPRGLFKRDPKLQRSSGQLA